MATKLTTGNSVVHYLEQELRHLYWMECPEGETTNLFHYRSDNMENRVNGYYIDHTTLKELLANFSEGEKINFCFYLSANPDIPYTEIREEPSFAPILSVFKEKESPNVAKNSVIAKWQGSEVRLGMEITARSAAGMKRDWQDYLKGNLHHLFFSKEGRIKSSTFDRYDARKTLDYLALHEAAEPRMNIYMGYKITTEEKRPYGFRFVIEIKPMVMTSEERVESLFLEFSNPCPPICK